LLALGCKDGWVASLVCWLLALMPDRLAGWLASLVETFENGA